MAHEGNKPANDELVESDVIMPPRDVTFDEARRDFSGDGLIPDRADYLVVPFYREREHGRGRAAGERLAAALRGA